MAGLLLRRLEPELMDDEAQARAYAQADFDASHSVIMDYFQQLAPPFTDATRMIDLGCGCADIAIRIMQIYPNCQIDGIDGSAAMLDFGYQAVNKMGYAKDIILHKMTLPTTSLPEVDYDVVVSNSLLHQLHKPQILWETVKQVAMAGTYVFIADLQRPADEDEAIAIVERYAQHEHEILRRDFYHSLLAAFTPEEVFAQLEQAKLNNFSVKTISDRHMIIYGCYMDNN